jgi:hypothetical protein
MAALRSTTTWSRTTFALRQSVASAGSFIGHPHAGLRSAVICSILGSCRRRGLNPQEYLTDVLGRSPCTKITQQMDGAQPDKRGPRSGSTSGCAALNAAVVSRRLSSPTPNPAIDGCPRGFCVPRPPGKIEPDRSRYYPTGSPSGDSRCGPSCSCAAIQGSIASSNL